MTFPRRLPLRLAGLGAVLAIAATAATPAHADFFDDARQTFTRDIPHFFQDDIPCAFGGQPTSGAKRTCRSAPPAPVKRGRDAVQPQPLDPPPEPLPPPAPADPGPPPQSGVQ